MKTKKIRGNLILYTAFTFAIALTLIGAANGYTAGMMHRKPDLQSFYTILTVGTVLYAGMGGLVVTSIKMKLWLDDRPVSYYLTAALVCGLAYAITTVILDWYSFAIGFFTITAVEIANSLQFGLIGACIGLLLGYHQKDRRLITWLTLVGIIGFSTYGFTRSWVEMLFTRFGFYAFLNETQLGFAFHLLVEFAIRGAITGLIGGALMGWVLEWYKNV